MNIWSTLDRTLTMNPQSVAVVDGDLRLTYAEVGERTRALAAFLRRRGVRAEDRIAILAPNSHEYLESYYAAAGLGAILVPINVRLAAPEIATILHHCEARWLIADEQFRALANEALGGGGPVECLLWIRASRDARSRPGHWDYAQVVAGPGAGFEPEAVREDAAAQIYYTSGTTGRPKGVILTHRNVVLHALGTIAELELDDGDVWGHIAPMFHLADAWATFAITWVGGRHVMVPRFDESLVLDAFEGELITLTNLVPTMLQRLVHHPGAGERDFASLRMLLSGGAPIAPAVVRRVIETFRCEYVQTYGMTETSPYLTLSLLKRHLRALPEEDQIAWRAKTGRPFLMVELEVLGDDGRPVARDGRSVGEIRARGPTVTPGYWRDPEATAAAFDGEWLLTGDLATIDAEGYLQIVDRKKDMIISGGEKVYSTEVEHVLYQHPSVLEAAVWGVPDEFWGESVRAAVVLVTGTPVSSEDLIAHCRSSLAGFKVPRSIECLPELPKTGSGKIQKMKLRGRA